MASYTAKDITVLEGLEPVRRRPGRDCHGGESPVGQLQRQRNGKGRWAKEAKNDERCCQSQDGRRRKGALGEGKKCDMNSVSDCLLCVFHK